LVPLDGIEPPSPRS